MKRVIRDPGPPLITGWRKINNAVLSTERATKLSTEPLKRRTKETTDDCKRNRATVGREPLNTCNEIERSGYR